MLVAIVAITAVVHIPINQRIVGGQVNPSEMPALLERWADFHWLRTLLALALPYGVVRFMRKASATGSSAAVRAEAAPANYSAKGA